VEGEEPTPLREAATPKHASTPVGRPATSYGLAVTARVAISALSGPYRKTENVVPLSEFSIQSSRTAME
jgi:hypothetical protein